MNLTRRSFIGTAAVPSLFAAGGLVARAHAHEALTQVAELRVLVPSPPGGAPDMVARVLAQSLGQATRVPATVQNIDGANGEICLKRFLSEPADGRSWLLAQESVIVINPDFYPRTSPDILDGLEPVAEVATNSFMVLVHADDPIGSFPELLAVCRAAGAPVLYGSGGVGSQQHLLMEELARRAGLNLTHVPYRGNSLAARGLIGGEIRVLMAGASALPLVRSGRLRVLAVTANRRIAALPAIPAVAEFTPGFHGYSWMGLYARAGTARAVVDDMRSLTGQLVREVAYASALKERGGMEAHYLAGRPFLEKIASERQRFADMTRSLSRPKS